MGTHVGDLYATTDYPHPGLLPPFHARCNASLDVSCSTAETRALTSRMLESVDISAAKTKLQRKPNTHVTNITPTVMTQQTTTAQLRGPPKNVKWIMPGTYNAHLRIQD